MDETTKSRIIELQAGDQTLYNFFFEKFDREVNNFGKDRMARFLKRLKFLTDHVETNCVSYVGMKNSLNDTRFIPFSDKVVGFQMNQKFPECVLMGTGELQFIDFFKAKQERKWGKFYQNNIGNKSTFTNNAQQLIP